MANTAKLTLTQQMHMKVYENHVKTHYTTPTVIRTPNPTVITVSQIPNQTLPSLPLYTDKTDSSLIESMVCKRCHDPLCHTNAKCGHHLHVCKYGVNCIHLTQPHCIAQCIKLNKLFKEKHIDNKCTYGNFFKWHRSCKNRVECRSATYSHYLETGEVCECEYDHGNRSCGGTRCRDDPHHPNCPATLGKCRSCYWLPSESESDDE